MIIQRNFFEKFLLIVLLSVLLLVGCGTDTMNTVDTTDQSQNIITTEETTLTNAVEENSSSIVLNENAELCLSKLEFGMSMSEAESAVNAGIDEEMLNPFYSIYNDISVDIDDRFSGAMFSYDGESGLEHITLYAHSLTEEECADLRNKVIKTFSTIYDISSDNWDIKEFRDYCRKDSISFYTIVRTSDDSYSVSFQLSSLDHKNFKNVEKKPILP